MAAFDASAWIGNRAVRPTDEQLATLENYDKGLGQSGAARLWRHLHYFQQRMAIFSALSGTTLTSIPEAARVPYKLVAVDFGCESAAASADAKLESNPAGAGYSDMVEAVVDIQAGAGAFTAGVVTDGREDIAYGDLVRLSVTAGAGACVGAQAICHCFRL